MDDYTDLMIWNQEIVNQGPEVINKKTARELTVHIDRFAYIFRFDQYPVVISFILLYLPNFS